MLFRGSAAHKWPDAMHLLASCLESFDSTEKARKWPKKSNSKGFTKPLIKWSRVRYGLEVVLTPLVFRSQSHIAKGAESPIGISPDALNAFIPQLRQLLVLLGGGNCAGTSRLVDRWPRSTHGQKYC